MELRGFQGGAKSEPPTWCDSSHAFLPVLFAHFSWESPPLMLMAVVEVFFKYIY